jgi:hypothetical protein
MRKFVIIFDSTNYLSVEDLTGNIPNMEDRM